MGAHKDNGIIHVTHKWRERAKTAEARVAQLEAFIADNAEAELSLATWIQRDRREPDKILTYAHTLRTRANLALMGEEEGGAR